MQSKNHARPTATELMMFSGTTCYYQLLLDLKLEED